MYKNLSLPTFYLITSCKVRHSLFFVRVHCHREVAIVSGSHRENAIPRRTSNLMVWSSLRICIEISLKQQHQQKCGVPLEDLSNPIKTYLRQFHQHFHIIVHVHDSMLSRSGVSRRRKSYQAYLDCTYWFTYVETFGLSEYATHNARAQHKAW